MYLHIYTICIKLRVAERFVNMTCVCAYACAYIYMLGPTRRNNVKLDHLHTLPHICIYTSTSALIRAKSCIYNSAAVPVCVGRAKVLTATIRENLTIEAGDLWKEMDPDMLRAEFLAVICVASRALRMCIYIYTCIHARAYIYMYLLCLYR